MRNIRSDKEKITAFEYSVYKTVAEIPKGKISTYLEVARAIGKPKTARAVGNALNKNPFAPEIPCHRVVKSDGTIGGFAGGYRRKRKMLEEEGIKFKNNKIVDYARLTYSPFSVFIMISSPELIKRGVDTL